MIGWVLNGLASLRYCFRVGEIRSATPANFRPHSGGMEFSVMELGSWLLPSGSIPISGAVNLVGL